MKKIVNDEYVYTFSIDMDKEQLRVFYMTMAKAHKNWSGGEPVEQELLKLLRDESWQLLLETQFEG